MIFPRYITRLLEEELEHKQMTVLTGMRQVGKTTLLHHLFEKVKSTNKAIFDFSDPVERKLFTEEDFNRIWLNIRDRGITTNEKAYLFIDEIQNLPVISQVAKYLYDHYDVKFVLSGSSSFYLKNLFPESMAGRKLIVEMFPLTFKEFLDFKSVRYETYDSFENMVKNKNYFAHSRLYPYYKEYMQYGGFPQVVLEENFSRKKQLLSEIFRSYFETDVKSLADFKELEKLRDLILLLSVRTGQILDITKLSQSLAISSETLHNYLTFLEQTYCISLLPRFSQSIDRVISGRKKVYFCDSGLASVLGRLSEGQMFEQSIFQNLRLHHTLSYYRNETGNEIDFITDSTIGIEAKTDAGAFDLANLKKRAQKLKLKHVFCCSLQYSDLEGIFPATNI